MKLGSIGTICLTTLAVAAGVAHTVPKTAMAASLSMPTAVAPNDPLYARQWYLHDGPGGINAAPAWEMSRGEGIVVAVLGTGIQPHSELAGRVLPGYDFVYNDWYNLDGDGWDADPTDPGNWIGANECTGEVATPSTWDGTQVAGIVAAATGNGAGGAGIAPDAGILPVRVEGKCGGWDPASLSQAIIWASGGHVAGVPDNPHPADVILLANRGNLISPCRPFALVDGNARPDDLYRALSTAIARGSTVVSSARSMGRVTVDGTVPGNDAGIAGPNNCRLDGLIVVGSADDGGALSSFSNYGESVDVLAPGGSGLGDAQRDILSISNQGSQQPGAEGYASRAAVTLASGQVAGIVALMQAAAASALSPAEVERIVKNTAHARSGWPTSCDQLDHTCGTGVVDARAAVAVARGLQPLPPDPVRPASPPATALRNGEQLDGIDVDHLGSRDFQLEVPNGASYLHISTARPALPDLLGAVRFAVRKDRRPTIAEFICKDGNYSCTLGVPQSGSYRVRLWDISPATYQRPPLQDLSLYASFVDANYPRSESAVLTSARKTTVQVGWTHGKRRVDIYRNGQKVATVNNTGAWKDQFQRPPSGVLAYTICNAGTQECSNPATTTGLPG